MLSEADTKKFEKHRRFRKWRWLVYVLSILFLASAAFELYQARALCRWYEMSFSDLVSAGGTLASGLSLAQSYPGYYVKAAVHYQEALRDLFVAVAIAGLAFERFRLQDLAFRAYEAQIERKV